MSGRAPNFSAICVPPAKSMPNFRPFWTKIARSPTRISAQEAPTATHFQGRKSMWVWGKRSMPASDRKRVDVLPPPVLDLEHGVRHEDGGEDGDEQADDQRHGESLDRPGAELEEEDRRDDDG